MTKKHEVSDLADVLTPGPWSHKMISANGSRFHVACIGDDDAPLVVFLHGFGQLWSAWREVLPAVAAAGYRAVAMDLRGSGASDKPPRGYDMPNLARDVTAVISSLGARQAVVIGQGLGGELAWALRALGPREIFAVAALSAPHPLRLRRRPGKLMSRWARKRVRQFQIPIWPDKALAQGDLMRTLLREWGAPGWQNHEALHIYQTANALPTAAYGSLEKVRWLVRSTLRTDGRRYRSALGTPSAVPVLQVHGALAGAYPVRSARTPAATPGLGEQYKYVELPGAGHFLSDEAPVELGEILVEWLSSLGRW